MSSTYLSLHYHLIFSTKLREPLIGADWQDRLHEYLGGTVKGLEGFPQGVGVGTAHGDSFGSGAGGLVLLFSQASTSPGLKPPG